MSSRLAVPLVVSGVHVALAVAALLRGAGRPLNRLFAALAAVLAVWTFSVFQIRHAPDAAGGLLGQRLLNLTFGLTPAVYYHLVRVVTGTAEAGRRAVRLVYAGAALFTLIALAALPLLVREVVPTPRGWAPVTGPLGLALFVFYLGVMAATLGPLRARRWRALLLASAVMLAAPLANFLGFILLRAGLITVDLPPLLLPASVVFVALVWFATRTREP
ncbi:MAG TPA: hypothetical protein VFW70_13070 [Methylomirabilota bacterium]|nr:hypothetical protein [Methylomirabilota bacterium]